MPPDLVFFLPLNHDARHRAIAAMAAGRWVRIGQCDLHRDEDGWIWGVDAYGQDCVAATADNAGLDLFERAVDWAIWQEERPLGDHPAERNYDFHH